MATVLPSCKHKQQIPNTDINLEEFNTALSEQINKIVETLHANNIDSTQVSNWEYVAQKVYAANNNNAIWTDYFILNDAGKDVYQTIITCEYYGLNKANYSIKVLQQLYDSLMIDSVSTNYTLLSQLDATITECLLKIALHLDDGMFVEGKSTINNNFYNKIEKYIALVDEIKTSKNTTKTLAKLEPQNPVYKRYMKALQAFVSKNNISPDKLTIRDYKTDSIGAIEDAKKALVYHHYLEDSLKNNDSAYVVALKQFQKEVGYNQDGVLGQMTARALERDNYEKFKMLAINADKWRIGDFDLPEQYVYVNLPAFKLKIIQKDKVTLEKNVVIGLANAKRATPEITSAINQIVLWPTWSVPQSIIKNEMKSFKGYKVTKYANGGLRVVQPPGYNNALGVVKILFPNKHSIYLHDTPSKYLFNKDYRAYSHGCVRCQDPLEIAAKILSMDTFNISYDSLKVIKEKKIQTRNFNLKNPVPVFIKYFTAEVDWDNQLKFYPDVYKRDEKYLAVIFKEDE